MTDQRSEPILIPRPLKPDVLCFGIKRAGQTVIFYNEDREIPDAPHPDTIPKLPQSIFIMENE